MEEMVIEHNKLIGRKEELNALKLSLESVISGKGQTILISGEAGIGKSRLLEEFRAHAGALDVTMLAGAASADSLHPFLLFSKALEGDMEKPLFHGQEYVGFESIFAVNHSGLLVAQATPTESELDGDILAGMLSAVQNFVQDSFDSSGESKAGLGKLEYGDMKILIEHSENLFLTAVFKGGEHQDMRALLKNTLHDIESGHGQALKDWSGKESDVAPVQDLVSILAESRFLVKRNLQGVNLEKERIQIANNVLEFLIGEASSKPVILILEDLHWADESSLYVFNYLARNAWKGRVLQIGTLRPEESETLEASLEDIKADGMAGEIALQSLDAGNVLSLVNEYYSPNSFSGDFIDKLAQRCEGNPFFVIELLRHMVDEGGIRLENGKFTLDSEDYTLPDTVEEVVRRRLEVLDSDAMAAAEYAACVGHGFGPEMAGAFKSLRNPSNAVEKLLKAGILASAPEGYWFSHAIFHDVIYNSIGDRWKSVYHKALGEYYESAFRNRLDDVLYDLARHFLRTNESQKAYEYSRRAGEKAEGEFAPEQALEFYEGAINLLPKQRLGEQAIEEEIILQQTKGSILELIGRWDEVEGIYRENMEMASKINDNKVLGRTKNALGMMMWRKGDFDEALELFTDAHRLFSDSEDRLGVAFSLRNIGIVHSRQGNFEGAIEHYEKTLAIAKEINNEKMIARTMNNMGILHDIHGNPDTAMGLYEEALAIANKIDDIELVSLLEGNKGIIYRNRGDLASAMECYQKQLKIAEDRSDKEGTGRASGQIGLVYEQLGDYDKAMDYFQRHLDNSKELGDKYGIAFASVAMGNVLKTLGQHEKADEYHDRASSIASKIKAKDLMASVSYQKADLLFKLGEIEKASALVEESEKLAEELKKDDIVFDCKVLKAKILARQDEDAAAQQFTKMLGEYEDEHKKAILNFELFKLAGDEKLKTAARELLTKQYEKSPLIIYKNMLDELES